MRDGVVLTYRLNRCDIRALREVWREHGYMPGPEVTGVCQVVDLGANIVFTSVYLSRRGASSMCAVEIDPGNRPILRRNLEQNGVRVTVLDAAAGDFDGYRSFCRDHESNLGRLDRGGELGVRVLSMPSVIDRLPERLAATLLRIDIEGGERAAVTGDVSPGWDGSTA